MEKDSATITAENHKLVDKHDIEELYRTKEHLEEKISKKCEQLKYSIKGRGLALVEKLTMLLKSYNRLQNTIKSQNPDYEVISTKFEKEFIEEQHERILRTINRSKRIPYDGGYTYKTEIPSAIENASIVNSAQYWEYDKKYNNSDWLDTLDIQGYLNKFNRQNNVTTFDSADYDETKSDNEEDYDEELP